MRDKGREEARREGREALVAIKLPGEDRIPVLRPIAIVGNKPFALGYITKARILYFLMGMAAAMFVAADVVAEFDKDPATHTATSYVKGFRRKGWTAAIIVALFPLWLLFHFTVEGFPL